MSRNAEWRPPETFPAAGESALKPVLNGDTSQQFDVVAFVPLAVFDFDYQAMFVFAQACETDVNGCQTSPWRYALYVSGGSEFDWSTWRIVKSWMDPPSMMVVGQTVDVELQRQFAVERARARQE